MALGLGMTVRFGRHYLYKWMSQVCIQLHYFERLEGIHRGCNSSELFFQRAFEWEKEVWPMFDWDLRYIPGHRGVPMMPVRVLAMILHLLCQCFAFKSLKIKSVCTVLPATQCQSCRGYGQAYLVSDTPVHYIQYSFSYSEPKRKYVLPGS